MEHPINYDPLELKHYNKPYSVQRRAKLMLISSVLREHDDFLKKSLDERFALVERIEKAIYKQLLADARIANIPTKWSNDLFVDLYTTITARIVSNLASWAGVGNDYLYSAILHGDITVEILPSATSMVLFPDKHRSIIDKLEASKQVKFTKKTSSMYWCRKCHKNQCTEENLYNRSLDEGVNLTITCVNCNATWKA